MICWLFVFSLFQIAALTGALSLPTRDSTSEDDAETWASVSGLEVDSIDMTYRSTFLFVINEYSEGEQHDQHQRQLIKQSVCFDKSFRPWTPRVVECYTVPPTSMISGELSKQDIVALKYFAHKTANSEEERSRLLDYSMLVNITSVEEDMRDFRFSVTFNGYVLSTCVSL